MQVPKPYIPNSVNNVTKNSKEEAEQVGEVLDQLSNQVTDQNLKLSLLKTGANYKFMGSNGTYDQSYLSNQTKQYGIIRDAWNWTKNKLGFNTKPGRGDINGLQKWGDEQYRKNKPQPTANPSDPQSANQKGKRYTKASQRTVQRTQQTTQPVQPQPVADPKSGRYKKSGQRTVQRTQTTPNPNPQPNPNPPANPQPDLNNPQPVNPNLPHPTNKISHDRVDDELNLHRNLTSDYVNNPNGKLDTDSLFQSGNVEDSLAENLSTANKFDQLRVVNSKGKVDKGATANLQNNIQAQSANAANHWYMDKTTGQVNENWRAAAQQAYNNATPMQRNNYQFLSQLARTYSNKKMIKLDNIKFFSDASKEIVVRMYADQLSEEEIQNALKWKNRKKKLLNVLKTLGGIGLAGAALYGGSKWYQNGGKDFLSKIGDNASDFVSKTGDAAIDAGKGIADASKDEFNRLGDAAARAQLEKSSDSESNDVATDEVDKDSDIKSPLTKPTEDQVKDDQSKGDEVTGGSSTSNIMDTPYVTRVHAHNAKYDDDLADLESRLHDVDQQIEGLSHRGADAGDIIKTLPSWLVPDALEDKWKDSNSGADWMSYLESQRNDLIRQINQLKIDYADQVDADLDRNPNKRFSLPRFVRGSQTRMFDQPAVQLNDEDIAKATAAKQRRQNFMNALKKAGWTAAGLAALYGGAKWYQNGGKGFVENVADQGANFAGAVGDATVNAGKGIAGAASNEANRNLDNWATNRVGGSIANIVANGNLGNVANLVAPPVQSPAVSVSMTGDGPTAPSAPAQPVVDGATGATIPATNGAQANEQAKDLVNEVAGDSQAADAATSDATANQVTTDNQAATEVPTTDVTVDQPSDTDQGQTPGDLNEQANADVDAVLPDGNQDEDDSDTD